MRRCILSSSLKSRVRGLAGLCGLLAGSVAAPALATVTVAHSPHDAVLERVYVLVNRARAHSRSCGRTAFPAAPPLAASQALARAAEDHARDMAIHRFFNHTGGDGAPPKLRVMRRGYAPRLTGENIAYGPESAEEVVAGWLHSSGHCENIMDTRFRDTGIAFALDRASGAVYWVQEFGQPRR
jgi:uncharacterized protein YkwD